MSKMKFPKHGREGVGQIMRGISDEPRNNRSQKTMMINQNTPQSPRISPQSPRMSESTAYVTINPSQAIPPVRERSLDRDGTNVGSRVHATKGFVSSTVNGGGYSSYNAPLYNVPGSGSNPNIFKQSNSPNSRLSVLTPNHNRDSRGTIVSSAAESREPSMMQPQNNRISYDIRNSNASNMSRSNEKLSRTVFNPVEVEKGLSTFGESRKRRITDDVLNVNRHDKSLSAHSERGGGVTPDDEQKKSVYRIPVTSSSTFVNFVGRERAEVMTHALCWFAMMVIVGFSIGIVNVCFHTAVKTIYKWWVYGVVKYYGENELWILYGLRVLGVLGSSLVTGLVTAHLVPECCGGGMLAVKLCLATECSIPLKVGISRFLLTATYIGFGNTLGIEAPTLHICASVSCKLFEWAQRLCGEEIFPRKHQNTVVILACTCGIACAFDTPLGGVLFVTEEFLHGQGGSRVFMVLLCVCLSFGVIVSRGLLGNKTFFDVILDDGGKIELLSDVTSAGWMLYAVPIGLLCGVASWAFIRLALIIRSFYFYVFSREVEERPILDEANSPFVLDTFGNIVDIYGVAFNQDGEAIGYYPNLDQEPSAVSEEAGFPLPREATGVNNRDTTASCEASQTTVGMRLKQGNHSSVWGPDDLLYGEVFEFGDDVFSEEDNGGNKFNEEDLRNKFNDEDVRNKFNDEDVRNKFNDEDVRNKFNDEDGGNKFNDEDGGNKLDKEMTLKSLLPHSDGYHAGVNYAPQPPPEGRKSAHNNSSASPKQRRSEQSMYKNNENNDEVPLSSPRSRKTIHDINKEWDARQQEMAKKRASGKMTADQKLVKDMAGGLRKSNRAAAAATANKSKMIKQSLTRELDEKQEKKRERRTKNSNNSNNANVIKAVGDESIAEEDDYGIEKKNVEDRRYSGDEKAEVEKNNSIPKIPGVNDSEESEEETYVTTSDSSRNPSKQILGMGEELVLFDEPAPIPTWQLYGQYLFDSQWRPFWAGFVTSVCGVICWHYTELEGIFFIGTRDLEIFMTKDLAIWKSILFFCMKIIPVCACVASDASGGVFYPALVMGGAIGSALNQVTAMTGFGATDMSDLCLSEELDNSIDYDHERYHLITVFGMMAMFSAVVRCPLSAVVIVYEMTNVGKTRADLIFPAMAASLISFLVSTELSEMGIYEAMLHQSGINLEEMMNNRREKEEERMVLDALQQEMERSDRVTEVATIVNVTTRENQSNRSTMGDFTFNRKTSIMSTGVNTVNSNSMSGNGGRCSMVVNTGASNRRISILPNLDEEKEFVDNNFSADLVQQAIQRSAQTLRIRNSGLGGEMINSIVSRAANEDNNEVCGEDSANKFIIGSNILNRSSVSSELTRHSINNGNLTTVNGVSPRLTRVSGSMVSSSIPSSSNGPTPRISRNGIPLQNIDVSPSHTNRASHTSNDVSPRLSLAVPRLSAGRLNLDRTRDDAIAKRVSGSHPVQRFSKRPGGGSKQLTVEEISDPRFYRPSRK